jgi:hypothetical protein
MAFLPLPGFEARVEQGFAYSLVTIIMGTTMTAYDMAQLGT